MPIGRMSYISRSANELNKNKSENPSHSVSQIDSSRYDLRGAVKLPKREEESEWIANNLFEFHKQICMLFETVSEYCTPGTCPKMIAGRKYEYWWSSGPERQPVEQCASYYINHLLDWVQEQLDDEHIFPTMPEDRFPDTFRDTCQTMTRRLFRVYAHIYHHHIDIVKMLKEEAHMNTSLKHFIYFVKEFGLVTSDQLEPLKDYIGSLT